MKKIRGIVLFNLTWLPFAAHAQLLQSSQTYAVTRAGVSIDCPAPTCVPPQQIGRSGELVDSHGSVMVDATVPEIVSVAASVHSYSSFDVYEDKAIIYAGASGHAEVNNRAYMSPQAANLGETYAAAAFHYSGSFELTEAVHFFIGSFAQNFEFGLADASDPTGISTILYANYDNHDLNAGLVTEAGILPAGAYAFRLSSDISEQISSQPVHMAEFATQLQMLFGRDPLDYEPDPGPVIPFVPEIDAQGTGLALGLLACLALLGGERRRITAIS